MLRDAPSPAIKDADLRTVLREEGLRLDNLVRQVRFQKASYSEVLVNLQDREEELARIPTISPVLTGYTITSRYGPRRDPFTGRRAQHNGLDFRAVTGTPVVSAADGTVSFVGYNGDFGLTIEIKHGGGIETAFCHLKSASVRPGQEVTRGECIGKVGSSGRSTGSHLHYEVRVDDRPVNPKKYILTPSVIVD
jgi:murein DD-endopeptidase MepM/ murein hydrolase activator NlpD